MEIVENKAVLVNTRTPSKITEVLPDARIVREVALPGGQTGATVAVKWTLRNTKILHNLGFKKVPSPITGKYEFPGMFKPMAHQIVTADFLTMHQKAFCLNDMGCVDSETEYLSPTGWVKISEYTGGKVAQFIPETGAMEFVEPSEYVKLPCPEMIEFKSRYGIDQLLSPEHRVLHYRADRQKTNSELFWRVDSAQHLHEALHNGTIADVYFKTTYLPEERAGIDLTEAQLRLQIAVIADGYFASRSGTWCVVRLKKDRKIERMRQLLCNANVQYIETRPEYEGAEGFHIFKFHAPIRTKSFDAYFWDATREQLRIVTDEVIHWDGSHRKSDGVSFYSTVKESVDFVQHAFVSQGKVARITDDKRGCWQVYVRNGARLVGVSRRFNEPTTKVVPSTDGFKYCFMVPSTFLVLRRNGCVFTSGNTGKTMSCIWAADYLLNVGVVKRVLIVAPLSILDTAWRADLFKAAMHRHVDIAHGTPDKRRAVLKSRAEFVIINYDGIEIVHKELMASGFDLIICDEASALKNANIKRWKLMNQLIRPETWLWLLTGTPAAQSPDEAYGLAKLVNPRSVPTYHGAFKDLVMYKVSTFKYVPRKNAQEIVHQVLQPAIRYTKEECLDLPEMTYAERYVPLTSQQTKYYERLKTDMLVEAAGQEISAANAAVGMNKLLQLASGAMYSDTGEVVAFDCKNRLNELVDIIEQAAHKVLVFANFKHSIDIIQEHLCKHNITNAKISGDVPLKQRSELINDFQKTKDPHVLIIQPQAAAHGITLHAADTIVWWSPIPSVEYYLQANARAHRAGQKNPCTVIHLQGCGLEKQMYDRLQSKKEDQEGLLAMYKKAIGLT